MNRDETKVIDPNTGGAKGQKQAQLGAVDPEAVLAVAEVAGFGGQKYARYNFAKGYAWSLSFDAMMRHALLFWGGEDVDQESGLPHMAHAGWHCLALLCFAGRNLGTDDRFPGGGVIDAIAEPEVGPCCFTAAHASGCWFHPDGLPVGERDEWGKSYTALLEETADATLWSYGR